LPDENQAEECADGEVRPLARAEDGEERTQLNRHLVDVPVSVAEQLAGLLGRRVRADRVVDRISSENGVLGLLP